MKNEPVREEHYGVQVWVNKEMDEQRRTECLCYNCKHLAPGRPESENCPITHETYALCKKTNLAMMITRCPVFEFDPDAAQKWKKP